VTSKQRQQIEGHKEHTEELREARDRVGELTEVTLEQTNEIFRLNQLVIEVMCPSPLFPSSRVGPIMDPKP